MITIDGIPSSKTMLDDLAAEGRPVILNFSRGKDSVATWLELAARGVEVIPVHKEMIPGLQWVNEDLARYEDFFGTHIISVPHEAFYRMLKNFMFQPPWRCAIIEAADLPNVTREMFDKVIRAHYADPDTWMVDGVRATDSPTRRMAIKRYGPIKTRTRRQSPIWDWTKTDVMRRIEAAGLTLGPDYDWFPRSLDGVRRDYLRAIKKHAPDDYQRFLFWFPLSDIELFREDVVLPGIQARKDDTR